MENLEDVLNHFERTIGGIGFELGKATATKMKVTAMEVTPATFDELVGIKAKVFAAFDTPMDLHPTEINDFYIGGVKITVQKEL